MKGLVAVSVALSLSACVNYGRWKGEEIFKGRGSDPPQEPAQPAAPQAQPPAPAQTAPAAQPPAPAAVGYGARLQPAPPPAGGFGYQPAPQTTTPPTSVPPPAASLAGGQRIQPEGSHASLIVPPGWTHGWGSLGSERVYVLRPNSGDPNEVALVGMRPITPQEAQMPMHELLPHGAQAFGLNGQPVAGPSALDIGGKRGGRLILRQTAPQGSIDSYLGAIVDEDVVYVLLSNYRAESSRAPVLDAVLQSMQVQAPPVNHALMQQLVGCWDESSSSGGGTGYAFSETRWHFAADGSYRYKSTVAVSVPGASGMSDGGDELGRYSVRGNVLTTQPQGGDASSYDVAFDGGMLYVGKDRYLPCH